MSGAGLPPGTRARPAARKWRGGPLAVVTGVDRVVVGVTLAMRVVAGLIIAAMMLTTAYDVIMRYVFHQPTEWALALNAAGVLAATFLAVPHLAATHGHISMDLVYRRMGARGQAVAAVVSGVATGVVAVVFGWLGYQAAVRAHLGGLMTQGNFAIPLWTLYALVALGGFGLLVVVVLSPARRSAPDEEIGADQTGQVA
ncbi:MAG: TRAP transporter small permease [Streptosporangiales bacterium]